MRHTISIIVILSILTLASSFTPPSSLFQIHPPQYSHTKFHRHFSQPSLRSALSTPHATTSKNADEKSRRSNLIKTFVTLALPAFIQQAAEPLASLVDSAYLGRLGPHVLGGAGVAISANYALSKLYNDPLLRTSITIVAAASVENENDTEKTKNERLAVAVSTALLLAAVVGVIQLLFFYFFSTNIIQLMGVKTTSPMYTSALSYLKIRALGTPAATIWLVTNGIYRGLGDTVNPLIWSTMFTLMNVVLDPILIFNFNMGAGGAAAGTAIAQYLALFPLLHNLSKKVDLKQASPVALKNSIKSYLEAGSIIFLRTIGKVLAYAYCASKAASLGSVYSAAYNLTFQLGFATTQICEGISVACQTLIAREIGSGSNSDSDGRCRSRKGRKVKVSNVKDIISMSVFSSLFVGIILSAVTWINRQSVLRSLTSDVDVQGACLNVFPAVMVTLVFKALAYPSNGIIMGGKDWKMSMAIMWASNIGCLAYLSYKIRVMALINAVLSLNEIWKGLAIFMFVQVFFSSVRVGGRTGVWRLLRDRDGDGEEVVGGRVKGLE